MGKYKYIRTINKYITVLCIFNSPKMITIFPRTTKICIIIKSKSITIFINSYNLIYLPITCNNPITNLKLWFNF